MSTGSRLRLFGSVVTVVVLLVAPDRSTSVPLGPQIESNTSLPPLQRKSNTSLPPLQRKSNTSSLLQLESNTSSLSVSSSSPLVVSATVRVPAQGGVFAVLLFPVGAPMSMNKTNHGTTDTVQQQQQATQHHHHHHQHNYHYHYHQQPTGADITTPLPEVVSKEIRKRSITTAGTDHLLLQAATGVHVIGCDGSSPVFAVAVSGKREGVVPCSDTLIKFVSTLAKVNNTVVASRVSRNSV